MNLGTLPISVTMDKSVTLWFTSAATLVRTSHGDYACEKSIPNTAFLYTEASEVTTEDRDKVQPRASWAAPLDFK